MSDTAAVVVVEIYKARPPRFRGSGRRQPWRWRAVNEHNRRILASGESFTNRDDCLASIHELFGFATNCYLVRREQDGWPSAQPLGYELLRVAMTDD